MLRSLTFRLLGRLAVALVLAACGDTLVDDWRESWAVVQGRVLDETDRPVAGATVRIKIGGAPVCDGGLGRERLGRRLPHPR